MLALQRLFSMFPNGWPGTGLLLLRLTDGLLLLQSGIAYWFKEVHNGPATLVTLSSVLGFFVLLGLWTPIAGLFSAATQTALLVNQSDDPQVLICLISINLAIAMLGPGHISIDAAIFGRHRLDLPER